MGRLACCRIQQAVRSRSAPEALAVTWGFLHWRKTVAEGRERIFVTPHGSAAAVDEIRLRQLTIGFRTPASP
jgi:hypothetical protein